MAFGPWHNFIGELDTEKFKIRYSLGDTDFEYFHLNGEGNVRIVDGAPVLFPPVIDIKLPVLLPAEGSPATDDPIREFIDILTKRYFSGVERARLYTLLHEIVPGGPAPSPQPSTRPADLSH